MDNKISFFTTMAVLSLLLLLLALTSAAPGHAAPHWVFSDRDYRLPVTIEANGFARTDKVVEIAVDFAALLADLGASGAFQEDSLRVVETTSDGQAIDTEVPFQFDNGSTLHNPVGTLVFLMKATTAAGQTRYFDLYFDTAGPFTPPASITSRVEVGTLGNYRGQQTFKITTYEPDGTTKAARYYYHKEGAGFASLLDRNGNDWISYYPVANSKSGGEYRGIPNAGPVFHPGYEETSGTSHLGSTSTLVEEGPLKVTVRSVSHDDAFEAIWAFYPQYAQMTMVRHGTKYWLLYEGTPGGNLDYTGPDRDTVWRSNGTHVDANEQWQQDLDPEWIYFDDASLNRVLYLVHAEDNEADSYRKQYNADQTPPGGSSDNGAMTVFGFGRLLNDASVKKLNEDGPQLTIGFVEDDDFATVATAIDGVYRPLVVTAGAPERQNELPLLDTNTGLALDEGNTAVITASQLAASDPEGETVTYQIDAVPAHGTLRHNTTVMGTGDTFSQGDVDNQLLSYQHNGSETTADSFSFTISDGVNQFGPATFDMTVTPVNDAPAIDTNAGLALDEGATATLTPAALAASDPEGQTVTYRLLTAPTHGALRRNTTALGPGDTFTQDDINNQALSYQHDDSETTADTFDFVISDGEWESSTSSFAITITAVNDAPTAAPDWATTSPGKPVLIDLLANDHDTDSEQLTITVLSPPQHGQLTDNGDGTILYRPAAGFEGSDSFTYHASDGLLASEPAQVTVVVTEEIYIYLPLVRGG